MPLTPGTRLGSYEIAAQIGVGGMGEVYRATDRNLGREVAIKVPPEAFAQDAERLARFEREARTLASLNHPNIAIIHGFEQSDGIRALVMELVEGATLGDRIAQSAILVEEALAIAKQIAEALEAAHEQGIVHRDLKPANVKVRDDGTVKVLDFGLAKMIDGSLAETADGPAKAGHYTFSPTITTPAMTQLGVILGTAAYMSPEQARGKPADKRSDIWAFGCVLYEMLTGKRAFDGEDVTDTLAFVISREPDWTALPPDLSPSIGSLIKGCVHKDRRKRVGDVSTALFILREQASMPTAPVTAVPEAKLHLSMWRRMLWPAAVVIASLATGVGMWMRLRPDPPRVSRLELNTSGESRLALYSNNLSIAVTGDGSHVIYQSGAQGSAPVISSRRLDQLDSTTLAERAASPFISPDGQWVGYGSQTAIRKVAITGGSSLEIVQLDGGFRGATWGADDTIVLATTALETGLLRVPSSGGKPSVLTRPDKAKGEGDHVLPRWVPGVNAVLFTITSAEGGPNSETSQIAVLDLRMAGAVPRTVLRGGSDARYVPTGHLVYVAGNSLWAVPFDADRLEVKGSAPVPVLTSMAAMAGVVGVFDIAADGTLVYLPASSLESLERRLVWVDRQGKEIDLGAAPKPYAYPRISPDGTRVAVDVREGDSDIWVWDLARRNLTRVSTDPGQDRASLWLDHGHLVYSSMSDGSPGLVMQRADGGDVPERLSRPEAPGAAHFPHALVPGGKNVIFIETAGPSGNDLKVLDLDRRAPAKTAPSLRHVQTLVSDPLAQANGVVSPDGRWLAYQSNESGSFDIYVRPFPDTNSGRHTVSNDGGTQPRWSATGRELFYVALRTNTMMAVPIGTGPSWSAGVPAPLFSTSQYSLGLGFPYLNYDVAKDGRFLLVKPQSGSAEVETSASLVVVQHWFEELKRLVPR